MHRPLRHWGTPIRAVAFMFRTRIIAAIGHAGAIAGLLVAALASLPAGAQPAPFCPLAERREVCVRPACIVDPAVPKPNWHDAAQCMRNLRDVWAASAKNPTARQTSADFARRYVEFAIMQPSQAAPRDGAAALLVERNQRGEAFNAMGQGGVAYFLLQFARLAQVGDTSATANWYRELAVRAIEALLNPVESGGFVRRTPCGDKECAWFHSVTRRDWSGSEGGTLNQDLHAIRDLLLIANGRFALPPELEQRLDATVEAALRQLLAGTDPSTPTLDGYFPPGSRQSLAFYGARLARQSAPAYYYLGRGTLDCHYHVHATELLFQIMTEAGKRPRLVALAQQGLACGSPLWRYDAAIRAVRAAPARATCDSRDIARYRPPSPLPCGG